MRLEGKTVLLTGATGGLGAAIARALSERGASVVLSARKPEALGKLADSLPGEHRILPADLAVDGAAEKLAADAGQVDCLVANAGLPARAGSRASPLRTRNEPCGSTSSPR